MKRKICFMKFLFFLISLMMFEFSEAKNLRKLDKFSRLADSITLENEYVIVSNHHSDFNLAENTKINSRVIVALSKIKIQTNKGVIRLKRGGVAIFTKNEKYHIIRGDFFEINIKNNHPKPIPPKIWYEPKNNKIVFDSDDFRIFEERLGAKEDRELHSHLQRLVVRLNNTHLTDPRFYPEGQPDKGWQVPNTVKFAEPVEHVVRNLSNIPVFNIVLEFKAKE